MKRLSRLVPAVLVMGLIGLAVLPPVAGRARVTTPVALAQSLCVTWLQSCSGALSFSVPAGGGVTQPLAFMGNADACSLTINPTGTSYATIRVLPWDPLTLAPDPTTIALRSGGFDDSRLLYRQTRFDFVPPLVLATADHVAEPLPNTVAIDYTPLGASQAIRYSDQAAAGIPIALQYYASNPRAPLPGPHPALDHTVCAGDAALQALQVVQSVTTCNAFLDTTSESVAQRFRLPAPARLHWIELAFGHVAPRDYVTGTIQILDDQGASGPPNDSTPVLVQAALPFWTIAGSYWASHVDFDQLITLEANHDYWIVAKLRHSYGLYARALDGSESADYRAAIGPLFKRTTPTSLWIGAVDYSLDFRIVGEPLNPVGVRPTPAARTPLALRVAPNPTRGAAMVSWSDAVGTVRMVVVDAGGRRVAEATDVAAADGRWLWRAVDPGGRTLPAGVYFVRAVDDRGVTVTHRVVVVR